MDRIAETWVDAATYLGADPVAAALSAADLEQRYAEPHRRYHTVEHIEAVLRDCRWLGAELHLVRAEQAVVALAACAHDVVYDAKPGADERASAAWARVHLEASGLVAGHLDDVQRLVLQTLTHEVNDPDDRCAVTLLDADLGILAAGPQSYARYAAGVRQEYAAVPDDAWRDGRAQVLRALLARPQLFLSEAARGRWESAARHNVQHELAELARS